MNSYSASHLAAAQQTLQQVEQRHAELRTQYTQAMTALSNAEQTIATLKAQLTHLASQHA